MIFFLNYAKFNRTRFPAITGPEFSTVKTGRLDLHEYPVGGGKCRSLAQSC